MPSLRETAGGGGVKTPQTEKHTQKIKIVLGKYNFVLYVFFVDILSDETSREAFSSGKYINIYNIPKLIFLYVFF